MKTFGRVILIIILIIIVVVAGIIGYIKLFKPNVGAAPDLKIEPTTAMIDRGSYLANHNAGCIDCHFIRDLTLFAGPAKEGTTGGGGEIFDHHFGLPGTIISKNITPDDSTGIGKWTKEIFLARFVVFSDTVFKPFPVEPNAFNTVMPWIWFSGMTKENLGDLFDYLYSLKPIANKVVRFTAGVEEKKQ